MTTMAAATAATPYAARTHRLPKLGSKLVNRTHAPVVWGLRRVYPLRRTEPLNDLHEMFVLDYEGAMWPRELVG
jgi:hypothetical protein